MTARAHERWMIAVLACGCGVDVAVAADSSSATAGATDTVASSDESSASTSGGGAGGSVDTGAESPVDSSGGEAATDDGPKLDVVGPDGDDDPTDCVPDNDLIWVIVLNEDREQTPELHYSIPRRRGSCG